MVKKETKIFFTFLLISSFFAYWTSWNEETNYLLTKIMVEEKTIYLEKYRNITGDIICDDTHCYARFSRQVFSSLCSFIYFLLSCLTKDENFIKFFLTIFGSGVFFSLSCLVIYKFSKKFLKSEQARIFATFAYGVSTLAFQQSRLFTTHSAEAFFALLAFYLFFRFLRNKKRRDLVLSAVLLGFDMLILPLLRFLFLTFFIYLFLTRKKKDALIFLLLGIIIYPFLYLELLFWLLLFNYPFSPVDLSGLPFFPQGFQSSIFLLPSLLQLLIFPSKGVLFFYPLLFFSFIGFFFSEKYRKEGFLLSLPTIFILLSFSSMYPMWWLGWVSYGPSRVLTVLMPLLTIGLIWFIERFNYKILLPFMLISAVNNFLLLQYGEDKISTLSWEEYKYKMEHFQVLSNPIFEHYLPLTLLNGPRSILLENLLINRKISIDFKHPYNPVTPDFIPPGSPVMKKSEIYLFSIPKLGMVVLKLPWLSLFVIGVLLTLLWKKEISRKTKINTRVLIFIFILTFFTLFIRIEEIVYGDNWCAPGWNEERKILEEGRWIGQNATLYLFSRENMNKTLVIVVESFKENQTLEIYVGGEFLANYTIQKRKVILQPIKLKEGINELLLMTKGDFINPWKINVSCDINLVSFKISKLSII